jgi:hypothetical protein
VIVHSSVATQEFTKPANLTRKKARRREISQKMAKITSFWLFLDVSGLKSPGGRREMAKK